MSWFLLVINVSGDLVTVVTNGHLQVGDGFFFKGFVVFEHNYTFTESIT